MVKCPTCGEEAAYEVVAGPMTAYLSCGHRVHPQIPQAEQSS